MNDKAVKRNRSVEKALSIVEVMAQSSRPMRLQEIASKVGIPASTAMRFLTTLAHRNYVSQDPESLRYALTLKLCNIANQISFRSSMRDLVRPQLIELSDLCQESSCLAVEDESQVVYIDVVEAPDMMLRTLQRIGKRAPLHSTGVGKCLLVNYTERQLQWLAEEHGFERLTENTITGIEELRREVNLVRERGYAVDNEECEPGVRCLAVPLRDYTGQVVASISISAPTSRLTMEKVEELEPKIKTVAAYMSHELGYTCHSDAAEAGELKR